MDLSTSKKVPVNLNIDEDLAKKLKKFAKKHKVSASRVVRELIKKHIE